jgi:hypothetical protein
MPYTKIDIEADSSWNYFGEFERVSTWSLRTTRKIQQQVDNIPFHLSLISSLSVSRSNMILQHHC